MDIIKKINALGLMSGTSLDGVDIAAVTTDGVDVYEFGPAMTVPYEDELREKIRSVLGKKPDTPETSRQLQIVEEELTRFHAEVVKDFMDTYGGRYDIIGFHGHTVYHDPQNRYTHQIGDGRLLAELTGIKVVNRLRNADIAAGGQGAPLIPVYHAALCADMEKPIAVLNIGGVSNLTWIGANGEMLAFDTGPGNAPVNDWVLRHGGMHMDYNGKLAIQGQVNEKIVNALMRHKFFAQYPPKSIDRDIFKGKLENLEGLSLEDGAATATAFTAEAIAYSLAMFVPYQPEKLIVCGGGAKNPTMMRFIRQRLNKVEVISAEELGWNTDAVEAQGFAFMAARRLYNMPISFPGTTGVPVPMVGGEIHEPALNEDRR